MSHTKEPWDENPIMKDQVFMKRQDLSRAIKCVNACIGLQDPEKNVRELVEAARHILEWKHASKFIDTSALKSALEPFKGMK